MKNRDLTGKFQPSTSEVIIKRDHAEVILVSPSGRRSGVALISKEDAVRVSAHRWFFTAKKYVRRRLSGGKLQPLHSFILKSSAEVIDHINGDPADNRRENLRPCTRKENSRNTAPRGGRSRFKGVTFDPRKRLFRARIGVNRRRIGLGRFKNEVDAAKAYDRAAIKHFGEFARTNQSIFPEVFK